MKKTLIIDNKEVVFSFNASFAYKFKAQFGYDILTKVMPVISDVLKGFEDIKDIEDIKIYEMGNILEYVYSLEFVDVQNLIWTFAKCNDDSIAEPEIWYSKFEEFELFEVLKELLPVFFKSIITKKKITKQDILEIVK